MVISECRYYQAYILFFAFGILQVFSGVKQPDPKPTTIQGVKQQDHFPCIDPDCIKEFRKENLLVQHLSVGQHVYDEQQLDTLEDRSKRLWSPQCSELWHHSTNSLICPSDFLTTNKFLWKSWLHSKTKKKNIPLFWKGEKLPHCFVQKWRRDGEKTKSTHSF